MILAGRTAREHAQFLRSKMAMRRRLREGIFSLGLVAAAMMVIVPQIFAFGFSAKSNSNTDEDAGRYVGSPVHPLHMHRGT